ncbi:barstar family protein [Yinghuangia soli]|uniref:Barstar family protein n=1 Tax=Yinghuangia soli TaxID=2908204 RepID=A0AA41TY16_9ACTN|nr:barstar family protein [Yinghuangia soli]MCF2525675.1 barstar family protein [Yinghuangia soli]
MTDEGGEALLAECADVEGLFAPDDPVADWVWLAGCTTRDLWDALLAEGREVSIWLAARDEAGQDIGGDGFDHAVVCEVVPSPEHPGCVDVGLQYRIDLWQARPELPSAAAAVSVEVLSGLATDSGPGREWRSSGDCRGVQYRVDGPWFPVHPLTLVGCTPQGRLADALAAFAERLARDGAHDPEEASREMEFGPVMLRVFDDAGLGVEDIPLGLDIAEVRPSVRFRGRVDLVVTAPAGFRPPPAARPVWELWRNGPPNEPGLWERLDTPGRRAWLHCAVVRGRAYGIGTVDDPPGAVYDLDGRQVTDEAGMYCALGEAVNGPGGYFGQDPQGLHECCSRDFGARSPFTIVWNDAEVARTHGSSPGDAWFTDTVALLREEGVEVVLR